MILAKINPITPGRWAVNTPYDTKVVELCRQVPGLVFDRTIKAWTGYTDAVHLLAERMKGSAKVVWTKSTPTVETSSFINDDRLRSYQQEGAKFLVEHAAEGVLIGDEMGLGKSRTTLCAIQKLELPAVIICPNSVKRSWVQEGEKIGVEVTPLFGTNVSEELQRTHAIDESDGIIVVNYDIVHAWQPLLQGAKTLVLDEVHMLINEKSRRSKACKELREGAKYCIGATGTPVPNAIRNLWNIVDTISPGRFGKFFKFGLRYCDGKQIAIKLDDGDEKLVWDWKGASNLDELRKRVSHFTIRRLKRDVQKELPALTRQTIEVDVVNDALALEWSLKNSKAARLALSIAAQSKIPHAVEMAQESLNQGSSVVIFCHEKVVVRETVAALAAAGIEAFSATGDDSAEKREKTAVAAKAAGPSVIVVTTHSMGVGVNYLTYADHAIFLELDYEPHWLLQSEARLHRSGQKKNVFIRYLVAIGTVDEAIRDAILSKMAAFEQTFGELDKSFSEELRGNEEDSLAEVRDYLTKIGKEFYS